MEKYSIKKYGNQEVFGMIEKYLTPKGVGRFEACGCWLEFFTDAEQTNFKVNNADFCKHRFCPLCMWRLAHKDALKISVLLDYLEQEHGRAFMFATFTAPNVKAPELPDEIKRFNIGFKNLMKREDIMRMNDGYVRKLEIKYNGETHITPEYYLKAKDHFDRRGLKVGDPNPNYDTYHTHFHCIFSVTRGYFSGGRYVKRDRWLELWRHVMGDDSITQVDVRRLKRGDKNKAAGEGDAKGTAKVPDVEYRDGFFEIAKYAAKDTEFTHSQEVFDVFYKALHKKQVLTYGGSFAGANKLYKLKLLEHYKTPDRTEYVYLVFFRWLEGYREEKRRALVPGEYEALKKLALDESPM